VQLDEGGVLRRRHREFLAELGEEDRGGALMGAAQEMPDLILDDVGVVRACGKSTPRLPAAAAAGPSLSRKGRGVSLAFVFPLSPCGRGLG
jgi:hypothetical protein